MSLVIISTTSSEGKHLVCLLKSSGYDHFTGGLGQLYYGEPITAVETVCVYVCDIIIIILATMTSINGFSISNNLKRH